MYCRIHVFTQLKAKNDSGSIVQTVRRVWCLLRIPRTKTQLRHRLNTQSRSRRSSGCSHLAHEDVEDPGGDGQRERGEEDGEEPGGGVHGGVEALGLEVYVQLWELLLKDRQRR